MTTPPTLGLACPPWCTVPIDHGDVVDDAGVYRHHTATPVELTHVAPSQPEDSFHDNVVTVVAEQWASTNGPSDPSASLPTVHLYGISDDRPFTVRDARRLARTMLTVCDLLDGKTITRGIGA